MTARSVTPHSKLAQIFVVLYEAFCRWYTGSLERQRHVAEEEVRRLGGRVIWDESQ